MPTAKNTCGRCGKSFVASRGNRWTTLCDHCPLPHLSIGKVQSPRNIRELMAVIRARVTGGDAWRCDYCGAADGISDLQKGTCSYGGHSPCTACGGNPFCEPDCSAMADILSRPDIYVAGKIR